MCLVSCGLIAAADRALADQPTVLVFTCVYMYACDNMCVVMKVYNMYILANINLFVSVEV